MDDWSYPDTIEAALYPLEDISKIAVSMYVGEEDKICPADAAFAASEKISTLQNFYTFKGEGHGFVASMNDF